MEIGPTPSSHHQDSYHHHQSSSFASPPRKRYLADYSGAPAGHSPAKHRRLSTEHRLSTDSLGSTGDRASPYHHLAAGVGGDPRRGSPLPHPTPSRASNSTPQSNPAVQQDVKPFSAFSIDNIIKAGGGADNSAQSASASPSR